jgi:hypothetical protein
MEQLSADWYLTQIISIIKADSQEKKGIIKAQKCIAAMDFKLKLQSDGP